MTSPDRGTTGHVRAPCPWTLDAWGARAGPRVVAMAPGLSPAVTGISTLVPTNSEALKAWTKAHRVYTDAAEVVLKKERQDAHDLDVVEALGREVQRALNEYRIARGERGK